MSEIVGIVALVFGLAAMALLTSLHLVWPLLILGLIVGGAVLVMRNETGRTIISVTVLAVAVTLLERCGATTN